MKTVSNTIPSKFSSLQSVKRASRKVMLWVATISAIVIAVFIYWKYFYTYSEGYRAGLLQKFSRKGNIVKTYEGEMILSSVISSNDVALASEKFYFSVSNQALAKRLDTIQGQKVLVHYRQRNGVLFWRGDTKYLVDSVKLIPK
jgi:hypothetical protein